MIEIEKISISDIIPSDYNPRLISDTEYSILQIIPYHILLGFAARHFFFLAFLFSSLTFSEHGQHTLAW